MPIRVFAPLQGFLRFYEGKSDMEKTEGEIGNFESMHFYCLPGDVVLHGYKRLGQDMWNADAGEPSGRELSADKRLGTAIASCMYYYSACYEGRKLNVCQLSCPTSVGWTAIGW